jgi:predicted kinase
MATNLLRFNKIVLDLNVLRIIKNKSYLIILQGVNGSGKSHFSNQLKKHFPEFEICSDDDYYNLGIKNISKSILHKNASCYCKTRAKGLIVSGISVIYNNINLHEESLRDVIQFAKECKFCIVLLRFIPTWNEQFCANMYNNYKTNMANICVDNVIQQNIELLKYKNAENIPRFGISVYINSETCELIFTARDPHLTDIKNKYIKNGYISPITLPKSFNFISNREINELENCFSNFLQISTEKKSRARTEENSDSDSDILCRKKLRTEESLERDSNWNKNTTQI